MALSPWAERLIPILTNQLGAFGVQPGAIKAFAAQLDIETGGGTSSVVRTKNNVAGIGGRNNYKSYPTLTAGLAAYVALLTTSRYAPVIAAGRTGDPEKVAIALGHSPWAEHKYRLGSSGDEYKGSSGRVGTEGYSIILKYGGKLPAGTSQQPKPSAEIADEKLHGSSSGAVSIPTADEGAALLDVAALGFESLTDVWIGGNVDLTTDMVSQVSLQFHDPGLKVATGLSLEAPIVWGSWPLSVAAIETSAGTAGTGRVAITARSALAQALRKKRPKQLSYPKRSVSQLIEQVLGSGAKFMLQPTPVQTQIVINTDEATGLPETWWDCFQRFSQDPVMTGGPDFLCYEAAGVVYFGAPSWLVQRCPVFKVTVGFDDAGHLVLDDGVDEMPTVRETSDDPDNPVSVSVRVRPQLGARIFPGMALELDMARFPGLYLVTQSTGDLDPSGSWSLKGVLPVDRTTETTDTPAVPSIDATGDAEAGLGDKGGALPTKKPTGKVSIPTSGTADISGFQPAFAAALSEFFAAALAAGHQMTVFSGYRSEAHQKRLWEAALKKYGSAAAARKWVAPPGRSNHGKGIAADLHAYGTVLSLKAGGKVGAATKWAHANAAKFGLYFPLSNEDWHIEPKGSRG